MREGTRDTRTGERKINPIRTNTEMGPRTATDLIKRSRVVPTK